jgi:polyphosphate:AMP phosphotransferase
MFETAELGQQISDKDFKRRALQLRQQLLEAQVLLSRKAGFSVMVDFAGVDGAGKGSTVNLLHSWMDTRLISTHAYTALSDSERTHPLMWRFWRDIPPAGRISLNLSGRYSQPLLDRVHERIAISEYVAELQRIQKFERALADDGMLIIKFWMHLSRDAQEQRLQTLEADPDRAWRVTPKDWEHWQLYDRFIESAERIIADTNTTFAPWHIIEGQDRNFRILAVAEVILNALRERFSQANLTPSADLLVDKAALTAKDQLPKRPANHVTVLDTLDKPTEVRKTEYRKELAKQQRRVHLLQRKALQEGRSSIIVFEGPDSAGKGGAIRRLIPALDARHYRVLQYGSPTEEEAARHYLWRFWRQIQRSGRMTIFDRSWYGRVLVERVENLATEQEWRRAYAEINDFEGQLIEHGAVLVKFWLHLSPAEQKARFESRMSNPHKRWKLTSEDWRNRAKWYEYESAAHDMVKYTSTRASPWELIPADSKHWTRIRVLQTFADYMERGLEST